MTDATHKEHAGMVEPCCGELRLQIVDLLHSMFGSDPLNPARVTDGAMAEFADRLMALSTPPAPPKPELPTMEDWGWWSEFGGGAGAIIQGRIRNLARAIAAGEVALPEWREK